MRLLWPEWAPDQPAHLSKALQVCSNVYPAANGYRPVKAFAETQTALSLACKGAASFTSTAGVSSIIAGTATTLYRKFASGWSQISTGYSIQNDGRWRFAQFGGLAIATNGADPIVKISLSDFSSAPLDGMPPKVKMLAVVKDFLVGGVIDGDVNKLRWAGINNAEYWTAGQRQSDYQVMPAGGAVTGLIGGEFGLVLQRNRICRMDYVGGNVIFAFPEISTNIGCVSVHSVIQSGQLAFWRSDSGFVMWDGSNLAQIGNERVDRYFDSLYGNTSWASASTAVDHKNNLVAWSMGDRIFIYNWVLKRWSVIVQPAEIIFGGVTPSISLEELDALYGNIDLVPGSLDSAALLGGDPAFYLFDASHAMGAFTGTNMAATLTLGDLELASGREARLSRVRPITDAAAGLTLTMGARQRLGDSVANTAYTSLTASGDMPIRERARYVRPSLVHAAASTWTFTQGLEIPGVKGAKR